VRCPATGAAAAITIVIGSSASPERSGEYARACCRYKVMTNRYPASTMNASTAMTLAPVNGELRKNRSSSSGSARRRTTATNAAAATAASAKNARIRRLAQPAAGPWMTAYVSDPSSTIMRIWPGTSTRRGRGARDSGR
jgi:hypothetical protein